MDCRKSNISFRKLKAIDGHLECELFPREWSMFKYLCHAGWGYLTINKHSHQLNSASCGRTSSLCNLEIRSKWGHPCVVSSIFVARESSIYHTICGVKSMRVNSTFTCRRVLNYNQPKPKPMVGIFCWTHCLPSQLGKIRILFKIKRELKLYS